MDTKKIRLLLQAVDAGSMMKIAESNGYTPSGLTHMMHALEEELGITLLKRSSRGVTLSEEGTKLLPLLKRYVSAEDKIFNEIKNIKLQNDTRIRVGAYPSIAKSWMPEIMHDFLAKYPGVEIELTTYIKPDAYQALESGTVDLILAGENENSEYEFNLLKVDPYYIVFPDDLTNDFPQGNLPLSILKEYPFIMPAYRTDTEIQRILDRYGIIPQSLGIYGDYQVIVNTVKKGLGVSIVSGLTLESCAQKVNYRLTDPPTFRNLGIVSRPNRELSPIKLAFISFIKDRCQNSGENLMPDVW